MREFLPDLLNILGPLLVAAVTYYTTDWLTKYSAFVDDLSPVVKRGLVLAVAAVVTLLAKWASVELPADLIAWTPDTIDTLVSAVLAMSVKAGNTAKAAKSVAADAQDTAGLAMQTADTSDGKASTALKIAADARVQAGS